MTDDYRFFLITLATILDEKGKSIILKRKGAIKNIGQY